MARLGPRSSAVWGEEAVKARLFCIIIKLEYLWVSTGSAGGGCERGRPAQRGWGAWGAGAGRSPRPPQRHYLQTEIQAHGG